MYDIEAFLFQKNVFLKQGQLPINLFRFVFVLLFKAKQRFAYLLLIQSVYLFLNVLFLFQSVFHFFKCFRFTIETIRYQSFIIEELVLSLTSLTVTSY